jgi:hypothetical protein
MKPNKENIINDILIELEKTTTFVDCFKLIQTKSNLARSTFSSYWNIANERYKDILNKRQIELDKISVDVEKERIKSALLKREEALLIVANIAKGNLRKVGDDVIIPSDSDRLRAIERLSKMCGWESPTKIAETDSEGNDKLNSEDLKELSDYIKKLNG